MKTILKFGIMAFAATLMFIVDMPLPPPPSLLSIQLMSDSQAFAGRARRTRRRGVAVGYAAGKSAAQQEQTTTAQPQSTTAQQQPANAPPPEYGPLPLGTVVPQLPSGCTTMVAGDVQYYHCGENYFRAAFQGNNLVYVTAKPG